jgi:hypothetical protein
MLSSVEDENALLLEAKVQEESIKSKKSSKYLVVSKYFRNFVAE